MHCTEHTLGKLQYLIRYPEGFDETKKYPTIFLLHGAGGRSDDIGKLKENPFFQEVEKHENFPFVVVAPLCSANTWFDLFHLLKELVIYATSLPFVDEDRFYGMGPSMGGYGTWHIAMSLPNYFAAIVPICGGGMYWNAARLINVPAWAFHGDADSAVYCEESKKMVNAVNAKGGNAKLTIYPGGKHNAWTPTYSNPEVFEWLLSHTNDNSKPVVCKYKDAETFG